MANNRKAQEVTLNFTLDEVNTILEGLGHLPFMRVYRIIEKIHVQVEESKMTLKTVATGKKKSRR